MGILPDDPDDEQNRHYVRRDQTMSRRVYRAQLLRSLFGKGVALCFMHLAKINASVAQRVLRSQKSRLRR